MTENYYNKIDFIIIIVLALLVAFIIGFNIVQIIDSKLSSVTINVPSQQCKIPPIYIKLDPNDPTSLKQINLNDIVSNVSNENNHENFDQIKLNDTDITESNENEYKNIESFEQIQTDNTENFGNIKDYPSQYNLPMVHLLTGKINEGDANQIINSGSYLDYTKDPNLNTMNNLPLLFAPDTDVPNRAGPMSKGYWATKVKLIEDPNSPLMKLAKQNADKINSTVAKCTLARSKKLPEINGTFDGYNAYVDLKTDSYANITSIGKSMLTPYMSYPVPS